MEYASKGVAGAGLGTGIAGLSLGVLNSLGGLGVLPNLVNGMGGMGARTVMPVCSEDHVVNRYEAEQAAKIAALETEVKLRDANIYTDQKILDVYERLDRRINGVNDKLCEQAVWNATQTGAISCMAQQIAALQGLTKIVIPKTSICPEPMDRYNSWTAPTETPATGG